MRRPETRDRHGGINSHVFFISRPETEIINAEFGSSGGIINNMKRFLYTLLILSSCILLRAQNYLPVDCFTGKYKYVQSYTKDWQKLGKVIGAPPVLTITILANNFDGRPRGSISYTFTKENYEIISSASLNYFGGIENGWYHFAAASEIYNPILNMWTINYWSVPTHMIVYKDLKFIRFSLQGNQWDEYYNY